MKHNTKKHSTKRGVHHAQHAHREPTAAGHLHKRRLQWFGVLVSGLIAIQAAYNIQVSGQVRALSYATDITHQQLLDATNAQRATNKLPTLQLDQKLSNAAQAKANDMVTHNYWSHTSPDGTTPWRFIDTAGYAYQTAGENLAYGFATSDAVITAWMHSQSHRANVLGTYQDIGIGFASSDHYQDGKNTVVVAFFGTPRGQTTNKALQVTWDEGRKLNQYVLGATVTAAGAAPWGAYASLGLTAAVAVGFIVTHIELMRLSWHRTKRFIILHPLIDAVIIAVIVVIIIQTAGGFIG